MQTQPPTELRVESCDTTRASRTTFIDPKASLTRLCLGGAERDVLVSRTFRSCMSTGHVFATTCVLCVGQRLPPPLHAAMCSLSVGMLRCDPPQRWHRRSLLRISSNRARLTATAPCAFQCQAEVNTASSSEGGEEMRCQKTASSGEGDV